FDIERVIEARNGTPFEEKKSIVCLNESTTPSNLIAPHSKTTLGVTAGGPFGPPAPSLGFSINSTALVLFRTSSPVSVVSKSSSMLSLAVLVPTTCDVFPPSLWVLAVIVYSNEAGLKSTTTSLSCPA